MSRRAIRSILIACLAAGALLVLVRPQAAPGVAVIGDGAPQVRDALAGRGWTTRPDGAPAAVLLVLLRRWSALGEHLPDQARLCRSACDGRADAVVLRVPGLRGRRTVALVDLAALGGADALDRGDPLPAAVVGCVVALAGEARDGEEGGAATSRPAGCAPRTLRAWRLPAGF